MDNKEKISELTKKIDDGIAALRDSDKYREYLSVLSRFHGYSFNNVMLILNQCPIATRVAGFAAWKGLERYVKKGEHGIQIIAPVPVKFSVDQEVLDGNGRAVVDIHGKPIMESVNKKSMRFKAVHVFDISQTEGKPLPELTRTLDGSVQDYDILMNALQEVSPANISFSALKSKPESTKGYYDSGWNMICIRKGMSQAQTLKTAIHEVTHAFLHSDKDKYAENRNASEIEAESVACVVCQKYGLDTSDYSFGYILNWSKNHDLQEFRKSLETIKDTAAWICGGVDEQLKKLEKIKYKEKYAKVYEAEIFEAHTRLNEGQDRLYKLFDIQPGDDPGEIIMGWLNKTVKKWERDER